MNFNNATREFLKILSHLIFPLNCPVCGKPAEIICKNCAKSLFAEKVITHKVENLEIFSASWYHSIVNRVISEFKYYGVRSLCRPIGKAMAEFFSEYNSNPENIDCLVPVPLHLKSERSYNQALEIAKGMSEIWKIRILDCSEWSKIMPNRAGLSAVERMKLKSDDFIISDEIKNLKIAVIDDVCTTGLTLLRFSEACEKIGGHAVAAYTLATTKGNLI